MSTTEQAPAASRVIYEIINPSDPYTMIASDLGVAAAAVVILGTGKYGLSALSPDNAPGVPLMLFWDEADLDAWFLRQTGHPFAEAAERKQEIAEALESVLIGRLTDRQTYDDGLALITDPANRDAWRARWHEQRRSSMDDIGARAWDIAAYIRQGLAENAQADGSPA